MPLAAILLTFRSEICGGPAPFSIGWNADDVPQSRMVLTPIVYHFAGHLVGITDRARVRTYDLMPALARVAVRVLHLILTHAPTAITFLTFAHDMLPNPIVRKLLKRLRLHSGQIRIMQWRLSVQ
jgi:hypothetical protein